MKVFTSNPDPDADFVAAQFYSLKPLFGDWRVEADPYDSEAEQTRLRELGIFFYRDENHHHNAIPFDESIPLPVDAWYSQILFELDGTEQVVHLKNHARLVKWFDQRLVNWMPR